jgi:hypothetical protein
MWIGLARGQRTGRGPAALTNVFWMTSEQQRISGAYDLPAH